MKHLLKLLDLSGEEISHILDVGDQMKYSQHHGLAHGCLEGRTLAMIFEKPSTRTRVSFETGMYQLGGHCVSISDRESQICRGEPPEDTARTLSRYCDAILIRTQEQTEVETFASYAEVPVINGLTDFSHPCQVLADLMTIREYKTRLDGLKLCYVGKGSHMANSLIVGGLKSGMEVFAACPEGYDPDAQVLAFAQACPGFHLTRDPYEAARGADVIATDAWVGMGQEELRPVLKQVLAPYQVDRVLLKQADEHCLLLHSLPACRGEEITAEVMETHAKELFDETENRLHVQKAVLSLLMGASL